MNSLRCENHRGHAWSGTSIASWKQVSTFDSTPHVHPLPRRGRGRGERPRSHQCFRQSPGATLAQIISWRFIV